MTRIKSKLIKAVGLVLVINIYVFSIDRLQFSYLAFFIGLLLILIFLMMRKISFSMEDFIIMFVPVAYLFFTLLYTSDFNASFRFVSFFAVFSMIQMFLKKSNEWHIIFFKGVFVLSLALALGTFYQYFFPENYIDAILPLFNYNNRSVILKLMRSGALAGLTSQTSNNAFLLSLGLGVISVRLLYTDKKPSKPLYLFFVLYVIAILMTMKRSFIVANIFCILMMFFTKKNVNSKKIRNLLKYVFVLVIIFVIISRVEPFKTTIDMNFQRFEYTNKRDFTSGRNSIYAAGMNMFGKSPLLGHGVNSVPYVLANQYNLKGIQQMHNIYIQFLAELGIIGTAIFVGLIVYYYKKTLTVLRMVRLGGNVELQRVIASSFYIQNLWLVYGFFGNPFTEHTFLLVYMLAAGIPMYYYKKLALYNDDIKVRMNKCTIIK